MAAFFCISLIGDFNSPPEKRHDFTQDTFADLKTIYWKPPLRLCVGFFPFT